MKLLVTGASGFLGQYVVAVALQRGHQVRAIIRPTSDATKLPWHNHPALELVRLDLQQPNHLGDAFPGVDAVLHLAAAKQGNFDIQYAGNVVATENLLRAMVETQVLRLVAISTFSVFDYLQIKSGEVITENSIIEQTPQQRDVYAQTKLLQENLFRKFEQQDGGQVTILRPGVIYGRDHLWNAHLGAQVSDRLWMRIGNHALIPLTYVENCAEAIVIAVECDGAIGQTLNIVDDDLPTQSVYAAKLEQLMPRSPYKIPISWSVMRLLADITWFCNQLLFAGKIKLPGIFVPARLHARFKPLRYSNICAQQVLNWKPKYSLDAALNRICSDIELLNTLYQPSQKHSLSPESTIN